MSSIRSQDTRPELALRKFLHAHGYRFRLHVKTLPGKPDIVLPKFRLAIWVQGCFWHRHHCKTGELPRSNKDYWIPKLLRNVSRDMSSRRQVRKLGWRNFVIWECQISCPNKFARRMHAFERLIRSFQGLV